MCHGLYKGSECNIEEPRSFPSASAEFWHRFCFKELLGSGQFGEVWRCVDRETGRSYACKEVGTGDTSTWQRVVVEIECMRSLDGHANIVKLHGVHRERDSVFIVMELCNGGDLFEAIANTQKGLGEEASAEILRQLVASVAHCHKMGFVHRDIKPENVLLHKRTSRSFSSVRHTVKLADFGLAERVDSERRTVKGRCGSPRYAAPEVKRGEEYSFPADVWSLGILLFVMLQADWPEVVKEGAFVQGGNWGELSLEVQDLLTRMLMPEPGHRATIQDVLAHPWLSRGI